MRRVKIPAIEPIEIEISGQIYVLHPLTMKDLRSFHQTVGDPTKPETMQDDRAFSFLLWLAIRRAHDQITEEEASEMVQMVGLRVLSPLLGELMGGPAESPSEDDEKKGGS